MTAGNLSGTAKLRSPVAYEQRLVAWVDILGWEELTRQSDPAVFQLVVQGQDWMRITRLVTNMRTQALREVNAVAGCSIHRSHFSDTVVYSCLPNAAEATILVDYVREFCESLLGAGLYTRGAITVGDVIHDADAAIGPAFIEAYRLEKSVACYPRLVISNEAAKLLAQINPAPLMNDNLDGLTFLDIFPKNLDGTRYAFVRERARRAISKVSLDLVDTASIQNHAEALKRRAKYWWLIQYLDRVLRDPQVPDPGTT
jgi:hypothetical protein